MTNTTWRDWLQRYPDTLALSTRTGFPRDYSKEPYVDYKQSGRLWFPVSFRAMRYHPKERIIGIEINGKFKAYPFAELSKTSGEVKDSVNGKNCLSTLIHIIKPVPCLTRSETSYNQLLHFGLHGMRFTMIQTYIEVRNHIGGIVSLSEYIECPLLVQNRHSGVDLNEYEDPISNAVWLFNNIVSD